jgi:hypothetical protein
MPNKLPARVTTPIMVGREVTRQELQVVAARREAENGIVAASLRAEFDRQVGEIEARVTAAVAKATLDTELDVLSYGIAKAAGSAAASKLVADRVEQLSRINTQNISRRFGA